MAPRRVQSALLIGHDGDVSFDKKHGLRYVRVESAWLSQNNKHITTAKKSVAQVSSYFKVSDFPFAFAHA